MEREIPTKLKKLNRNKIDRVVRKNWGKLRKKGVLAVRPGYAFTGGWITNQPSAVAILDKKGKVAPKDELPPILTVCMSMCKRRRP